MMETNGWGPFCGRNLIPVAAVFTYMLKWPVNVMGECFFCLCFFAVPTAKAISQREKVILLYYFNITERKSNITLKG